MKLIAGLKPIYILLSLLVLVMLITIYLAQSATGLALLARYLPTLVPGLSVEYLSGNLTDASFKEIKWQDDHMLVQLTDVEWQLDPYCLLDNRLCFQQLDIHELAIAISASDASKPLDLTPVILPLEINVENGSVQTLRIRNRDNPEVVFGDLELAAFWRLSTIKISRLAGNRESAHAELGGYIELRGQLPMEISGDITYTKSEEQQFAGRVSLKGSLNQLALNARLDRPESLALTGRLYPLKSPMTLDAIVTRDSPLDIPGSEVTVNTARLELTGTLGQVQGQLTASISESVLGTSDLQMMLNWDGSTLQIESMHLQNAAVSMDGSGKVSFDPTLSWQLDTRLTVICQPEWRANTECTLAGPVRTSGSLNGDDYSLNFVGNLSGELNGEPASITANTIAYPGNRWTLDSIALTLGASTLHMQGKFDNALAISGDLELTDLAQLDPRWQGMGHGKWQLEGSLAKPELTADLSFRSLESIDLAVSEVDIHADWKSWPGEGSITLDARNGRLNTTEFKVLNLACHASLIDSLSGQIECSQLDLVTDSILGNWQLAESVLLTWKDSMAGYSLAPFCIHSTGTSVCSTGTIVFQGNEFQDLHLIASNIAVDWLRYLLPPEIEISGTLGLTLDAENTAKTGMRIAIKTQDQQLTLGMYRAEQLVQQPITRLNGQLLWEHQQLELSWDFAMGKDGTSTGQLVVNNWDKDRNLNGTFEFRQLDIAPFILPNEGVLGASGLLNGTISLQGNVSNPLLTGKLQLSQGRFEHEQLPAAVENFNLDISFDGPEVVMRGGFSLPEGNAFISGSAHLGDDSWLAKIDLKADNLVVEPLRGSEVTLQPDLQISLTREKASIRGNIAIPKATIVMDRLPKTARNISPDTIIVGEDRKTDSFDYELAINLKVGNAVNVRALGANANLKGHIELTRHLGQPLLAVGEIEIVSGRYLAYGQRLEVKEGKLFFNGPLQRPQIRLVAVRPLEVQDVQVGVRVSGDAKFPEVELFSQPVMDENLTMYYLLTGRAPEAETNLELAVATAMLQLGISSASEGTTEVLDKLGIQNFQIDAREQEQGTEFGVSGYVSPRLYLGYGVSTFDKVYTVRARYRLQEKLYLEAISGAESAIDFLYSITR